MAQDHFTAEQSSRLQAEIQRELERREWAETDDLVMAEYLSVLIANGSSRERIQTEMEDLVGSDFDNGFLDWLFTTAESARHAPEPIAQLEPSAPPTEPSVIPESASSHPSSASQSSMSHSRVAPSGPGASRLFGSAIEGTKRKFGSGGEAAVDEQNKRHVSNGAGKSIGMLPSGPRGMNQQQQQSGRSLADRIAPGPPGRTPNAPRGMNVRGAANPRIISGNGHVGPGFRLPPNHQQQQQMQLQQHQLQQQQQLQLQQQQQFGMMPGFAAPFMPGQQEMMMQMMAMQANMAQMAEQMRFMASEQQNRSLNQPVRPVRPTSRPPASAPVKLPPGTKLGNHAVSTLTPKPDNAVGPIPDKPSSTALCKFSVACSNAYCIYSHPSPAADEKNGMVLSEEPCEQGKKCKDPECIKSHISPAAVLGASAGPQRMLCKFQNCTNPSCQYRHEDEAGNLIPPPALTAAKNGKTGTSSGGLKTASEADDDLEVVVSRPKLMTGALDDTKVEKPCRYGDKCTRADCKFSHPSSRRLPGAAGANIGGGLQTSKKFGSTQTSTPIAAATTASSGVTDLNPTAIEFKPAAVLSTVEGELHVTS